MRWAVSVAAALGFVAVCISPALAAVATGEAPRREPPEQTRFSVDDLLNGKEMTAAECRSIDMAVWVTADGASECLRYYLSAVADHGDAVVLLHGDFVDAGPGAAARVVAADYGETSVADELNDAAALASEFGRTFIVLARPGTFGSSGNELKTRHSVHEARLVDAALDAIAARYGIRRFHLVGQSGGAILIGALLALRGDIGCAVMGSGRLSVAPYTAPAADIAAEDGESLLDDQAYADGIRRSPALRPFVISDPADARSALAGQTRFVARAIGAGAPVRQILTVSAVDGGAHHDVMGQALRVAEECVEGTSDGRIRDIVQQFARMNARAWSQQAAQGPVAIARTSDASASAKRPAQPKR